MSGQRIFCLDQSDFLQSRIYASLSQETFIYVDQPFDEKKAVPTL